MADSTHIAKVTLKGYAPDDTQREKIITIGTISGIDKSSTLLTNATEMGAFIDKIQPVISATITRAVVTSEPAFDVTATHADPLSPEEIFTSEFSDITVVPTLNITNVASYDNKTKAVNLKYMGDPQNTAQFEDKVQQAAAAINEVTDTDFVKAYLKFTAKDELLEE